MVNSGAHSIQNLAVRVGMSNDHFVRTTEPAHKDAVEYAWVSEVTEITSSRHSRDTASAPGERVHIPIKA